VLDVRLHGASFHPLTAGGLPTGQRAPWAERRRLLNRFSIHLNRPPVYHGF